jgi:hypothetical protein
MARKETKEAPRDEQKWQEAETAVGQLQSVLDNQKDDRMHDVKVWVNRINEDRGLMYVGISLGEGLGCSPFCGCAAKQIGDQFEPFLLERVSWLNRTVMEPQSPVDDDQSSDLLRVF